MDFRTARSGSRRTPSEGKEPASAGDIGIGVGKTSGINEPIKERA